MEGVRPLVIAIVGADGCGKTSAYRGLLERLGKRMRVSGIGEGLLVGGPGVPLAAPRSTWLSRTTALMGGLARRTGKPRIYRPLKLLELSGRSRLRAAAEQEARARVVVTDGDPLVNSAAWSAADYYARELAGQDDRLMELVAHLSGARRLSFADLARLPRRAWQLALAERLGLVDFETPDLVILLDIDGASAMARIRARGRPLQAHEDEARIDRLARGYARVCDLLAARLGVGFVRIDAARSAPSDVVDRAEAAVLEALTTRAAAASAADRDASGSAAPDVIDVIATTISGSLQDQRNVGRIGPEFRRRTARPVRVHEAASHEEARSLAHDAVAGGGRMLVSAGGAGTFNAVLEGCHLPGGVPADLRLAFLRKGSADLIGKALHVPGELEPAVAAIVAGIERDVTVRADILAVEAGADGSLQRRHVVGFGGLGVFGDVPTFTESRFVKLYKGVLGTLFGDYGPFFVGLALATVSWFVRQGRGQVAALVLAFDGQELPPATWLAVIVANGDLGPDFPLGRGLPFESGTFRVVALRYEGVRSSVAQLWACRSGAILAEPGRYEAVVREVRSFSARPLVGLETSGRPRRPDVVNVDGLRMLAAGEVRVSVSGSVRLIVGQDGEATGRPGFAAAPPRDETAR